MKNLKETTYLKYSKLSTLEKNIYYENVFNFLRCLTWEYPNFALWYKSLFNNNKVLNSDREIILCEKDLRIVGVMILKSDNYEKKICTLRVAKEYQKQGIGKKLLELGLEWLDEEHPMITMHRNKQPQFRALLSYYGFELEQKKKNYYSIFSTELVYNGVLPEKQRLWDKMELLNIRKIVLIEHQNLNKSLEEYIEWWYSEKIKYLNKKAIW